MFPPTVQTLTTALLFFSSAVSSLPAANDAFNVKVTSAQAPKDLCGNNESLLLQDTPWIVFNMLYNAAVTKGTQCTHYEKHGTTSAGVDQVVWSSVTNIDYVQSTNNVPKGYSFIGLTQNLSTKLSAIASIPSTYIWTSKNTTSFKGNVCYDFMTSPTKGDSTSTSAKEHMLWLSYSGGQLPIGWPKGPVATIDSLFGTNWKLYEDVNTDTGITVSSLLPDKQFQGSFSGDVKQWLEKLVELGKIDKDTYVNVGNGGTEFFYGARTMNASLGLQVNLS